jgi:YD repeat-containing protein
MVSAALTACALSSAGCTAFLTGCGQDLSKLTTQVEVHKTFGPPAAVGQVDGHTFEEFTTHRKIAEHWKGIYLVMGDAGTLGFGEFIWFPHEAWLAGRRSVLGQKLRFTYDDAGKVIAVRWDGEPLPTLPDRKSEGPPPTEGRPDGRSE